MNSISWALDKLREGRAVRRIGKTGWLTLREGVLFLQGKNPDRPEGIKYWHPKQEDVLASDWEDIADRPLSVEKEVADAVTAEGKAGEPGTRPEPPPIEIDPFASSIDPREQKEREAQAADVEKKKHAEFDRQMAAGLKKEQHTAAGAKPSQPSQSPPQSGLIGSKEIPPKTHKPG